MLVSLHGADPLPARLASRGVPVVLVGRPYRTGDGTPYVDADNVGGGRLATRAMIDNGRQNLGTITGPRDMVAAQDRLDGFRAELASHGRRPTKASIVAGDFSVSGGERAMHQLLDQRPGLDGVFAANDLMAVGAMQAIALEAWSCPTTSPWSGYDDVPVAAALRPQLTTVRQPLVRMGEEMATLLIDALEGRPTEIVGHPPDGAGGAAVGLIRRADTKSSLDNRRRLLHHFANRSWERSHEISPERAITTATRQLQPGS